MDMDLVLRHGGKLGILGKEVKEKDKYL